MDAMYEIKFDRFNHQMVVISAGEVIARTSDCSPAGQAAMVLEAATKLDEMFS